MTYNPLPEALHGGLLFSTPPDAVKALEYRYLGCLFRVCKLGIMLLGLVFASDSWKTAVNMDLKAHYIINYPLNHLSALFDAGRRGVGIFAYWIEGMRLS